MDYSKVTICSYCFNHNEQLNESVLTWLSFPVNKVIIVDWSSTTHLKATLSKVTQDPRVTILRVEYKKYLWLSKIKNLAGDLVETDYAFFIDPFIWLRKFDFEPYPGEFYRGADRAEGCLFLSTDAYWISGGYCENYITSIGESGNFHDRLVRCKFKKVIMPEGMENVTNDTEDAVGVKKKEPNITQWWGPDSTKTVIKYSTNTLVE